MTTTAFVATTDRMSFSFYVDAGNVDSIRRCSEIADAVTLRGAGGPRSALALRRTGWNRPVLFDRCAYEKGAPDVDTESWYAEQTEAGADRLLTPGRWVPWSGGADGLGKQLREELKLAEIKGATALIAVDYRWLTKGIDTTLSHFRKAGHPIALALAHRDDPLSAGSAVDGLINICKSTEHLTVLRSDHGAVGALAFDAIHASLGLRTSTRHLYPPSAQGGGGRRDDPTPRLFVSQLLDWYTGFTIAGWSTSEIEIPCSQLCCQGASLARFLDARLAGEAEYHNELALAELATYVINAPPNDRRRLFAQRCKAAVDMYDRLGSMALRPKAQLEGWQSGREASCGTRSPQPTTDRRQGHHWQPQREIGLRVRGTSDRTRSSLVHCAEPDGIAKGLGA